MFPYIMTGSCCISFNDSNKKDMIVEEYRQKIELLLMRRGYVNNNG